MTTLHTFGSEGGLGLNHPKESDLDSLHASCEPERSLNLLLVTERAN